MKPVQPVAVSVTDLTRKIKSAIEGEPELRHVWVRGEISNFTRHSSGHLYFNLKDKDSQIRAVMFRRYADTMSAPVADGHEVLALGGITVYEKRGEYQLYVQAMRPAGLGALHIQFEELKKKLAAEGLFNLPRKPIPFMPDRIAVVTSPTGAAVRDVVHVISRRYPAVELTVVPAVVQGDAAPASIRAALARAQALPGVDTILLVRGGGSIEDLWGFNDEGLARDIAACSVPVISGVGHETDFTIADFVSDLRAPTPSAAAETAVPELSALREQARAASRRLTHAAATRIRLERSRLQGCQAVLSPRRMRDRLNQQRQAVDDMMRGAQSALKHRLASERQGVESLRHRLRALDPFAVLGRGYAVLRDAKTQSVITSISQVSTGREIDAVLTDGALRSVIVEKRGGGFLKKKKPGELDL
jgi:exodeoxyribonuclease VII large subunit